MFSSVIVFTISEENKIYLTYESVGITTVMRIQFCQ